MGKDSCSNSVVVSWEGFFFQNKATCMGEIFVWLKVRKMRTCQMAIEDTTPSTKVHI